MTELLATAAGAADGGNEIFLLWGFIALGAAIGLVMLELFVPSGGLIGLLAAGALIASVVAFFRYSPFMGWTASAVYLGLGPFAVYYGFKFWASSPIGRRVVLGGEDDSSLRPANEDAAFVSERARQERAQRLRTLIGAEGVTATTLRPVGTVVIQGERVDALAEEGMLDADVAVLVVDAYDNQIKVRRVS